MTARYFAERNIKYILIAPAVGLLLVFSVYPLARLFQLGFSKFRLETLKAGPVFNGLHNLRTLLGDPNFMDSFEVTLTFVIGVVIVEFIGGFAIAMAVDRGLRTGNVFRAIFVIPMMVPPITIGLIWRLMLNPRIGIINQTLRALGMVKLPAWLADPALALPSVMAVDIWHWTPFVFLLIFAGLQSLPTDPYEAASIEGASASQKFRHITLPLMRQTIFVTLMFRTVLAFKAFDELFILTSGGPGNATEIIGLYIYRNAFLFGKLGYASFLAIVTILLMLLVSGIFQGIISRFTR